MKTVKNKIKKGMTLLLAVTLLLAMGLTAHGEDSGGSGSTKNGFNAEAKKGSLILDIPGKKTSSQFSVYQVLTATADKGQEVYEYTYTDSFKSLGEGPSPTLPIGQITGATDGPKNPDNSYKIDTDTVDKAAAELEKHVKTNSGITATATISNSNKTASSLPLGYYLILETTITAGQKQTKPMLVAIPSVTKNASTGIYEYNYNVSVTLKDQSLKTEKKIVVDRNNKADTIAKQVGEEVTFEIVQDVPKYDDTHKKITFKVVDTMSKGLTFRKVTSVKADGKELTNEETKNKYGFEKTLNNGITTLTFDFSDHTKDPSKPGDDYYDSVKDADKVTITYTARLNKDASFGVTGNSNKVYAEFGDGSVNSGEPTNGASVYTINYAGVVEIRKVGEPADPSGIAPELKDVKFTIYKESGKVKGFDEDDKETQVVTYTRNEKTDITDTPNQNLSSTDTTGADGIARFAGLGDGTYYIKETSAPNPYVLLKEPITVKVEATLPKSVTNGDETVSEYTYTVSGKGVKETELILDGTGKVTFTVENKKGFVLPTTGGMGTYLFTIGGALLILAAVVLILRSRKKTN